MEDILLSEMKRKHFRIVPVTGKRDCKDEKDEERKR